MSYTRVTFQSGTLSTPPSGTDVAVDNIDGDDFQRIKVDLGAENVSSPLVRGQQATASSLPVALSTEQQALLDGLEGLLTTIDADTGAMVVDLAAIEVLLGTIDADTSNLAAILTSLQTLDNIVSGSEAQVDVVAALPAGDNNIGNVDIASAIPAGTNNIGDVDVASIAAGTNTIGAAVTSGHATAGTGQSMHFDADGDNTAQAIKASAGRLYALEVSNPNGVDCWLQLFNTAAGSVTVGTTTPVQSYFVPASGAMDKSFPIGLTFTTAITYACTTTPTGSGDPTTGLRVNAGYV